MISEDKFIELVDTVLDRNISENINQKEAIMADISNSQYIVAGPGSGKTTVLVLKILKYFFVDDVNLDEVIVTTFTKKAARELNNRTIEWAKLLCGTLDIPLPKSFNSLMIGTLDSIAEDYVSKVRDIDVIDNFTSSAVMMQTLLDGERNTDKRLKQFFKQLKNNSGGVNTAEMNNLVQDIRERLVYDMVDYDAIKASAGREQVMYEIIDDYNQRLYSRDILDYPLLERIFYDLLADNLIPEVKGVRVLLIDEYQDTNYLQEQIYFKLARHVNDNNGNITVVGDDDQSLYRFRGASVELFTDYVERIDEALSIRPNTIFLQKNYRSTSNIIDFTNEFIHMDNRYLSNRTINKPLIVPCENTVDGLPVIGLFRNNIEELSTDLSNLIYNLKMGNSFKVTRHGVSYDISAGNNPSIALLINSPKEINAFNKKRLPFYVRESISYKDEKMVVFNPRGQNIESTDIVSLICGLILLSIDPEGKTQDNLDNIPPHTKNVLKSWRKYATEYISSTDKSIILEGDVINLDNLLEDIDNECNSLVDESQENAIYHDIIMDTITQTKNAITVDGLLSTKQVFWHILVPIASGAIDIDDDMFEINYEDNINIMSIHQSKGLEFDVVIVDVGSDIYNNSSSTAFKRFPNRGGKTFNIERYLRKYSSLDDSYDSHTGLDDEFNDLIRRYFVAYTRAKSVLILVGLNSMRYGYKGDFQDNILIPNVATGWSRDKVWHWDNLNNLLNI